MMRIGWSSEKKKVGIGRLIDWMGLWEFRHCWNFVIAREQSRGAISLKIPSLSNIMRVLINEIASLRSQ